MKLEIETIRDQEGLNRLQPAWQELFKSTSAAPFLSWEWAASWQTWFGRKRSPHILCARDGAKLVGILPLSEEVRTLAGPLGRVSRLSFLGGGDGCADYLDVLTTPQKQQEVSIALFDHLAQNVSFDVLELNGVFSDSITLPLLIRRFSDHAKLEFKLSPSEICPQIALSGSWEDVLKRSKRAKEFKRRLRQIQELDGFEHRIVTDPSVIDAAFGRFLTLHEKRWSNQGGSSATGSPNRRAFQREAVARLARLGLVQFEELWIAGQCAASLYGMNAPGRFCFYNIGTDPAWYKKSVGFILLGLSIEGAVKRGLKTYDFLRGVEAYKFDWASHLHNTMSVKIISPSARVKMMLAREWAVREARAKVKSVIPAKALRALKRLRHSESLPTATRQFELNEPASLSAASFPPFES